MPRPIIYIDTSTIREGKLDELEEAMKHLAAFVEANMPQLISYGFFLDQDSTQMRVVAVHPDSASLEFHLDVGGDEFRKFADLIDLSRIEVSGQSPTLYSSVCIGRRGCWGVEPSPCTSFMRGSRARQEPSLRCGSRHRARWWQTIA